MKPGTLVASRYTLVRELGRGGMGAVFVARDERLGGEVALKVAFAGSDGAPELRERFQREARIGNRLGKTTGFVRAFDFGEVEGTGQLYLAMDLVQDARALDLTSGQLEVRMTRLRDAARLVAEAHRQGVVHRDLKPANFLQEPGGRLWLSDFGLSKVREEVVPELADHPGGLTRSGVAAGTPAFMPPEQFEDVKRVDARADVFALGVMLYAALTEGKLPYDGSLAAIAQRQARVGAGLEPPPSPGRLASVPPELERVCLACLELERERRLGSADLLVAALDAFVASRAKPSTPRAPASPDVTLPTLPAPPEAPRVRRVSSPPATPVAPVALVTPVARQVPSAVRRGPSFEPDASASAPPTATRSTGCCAVALVLLALALIGGLALLAVVLLRTAPVASSPWAAAFELTLGPRKESSEEHAAALEHLRSAVERRAQTLVPLARAATDDESVVLWLPSATPEATLASLDQLLGPRGYVEFRIPGDGGKLAGLTRPLFTSDDLTRVDVGADAQGPTLLLVVRPDLAARVAEDTRANVGASIEAAADDVVVFRATLRSAIVDGKISITGPDSPERQRLRRALELRESSYPGSVTVRRTQR